MATSRAKAGKIKAEEYLKKLDIVRKANDVNPFETKAEQQARIARAKVDPEYMVKTYLPHYAMADSAPFHIKLCHNVAADPLLKEFEEWGRGLAKSVYCNIIVPLFLWIRGEEVFMCLMSDSKERAQELLADIQAELEGNPLLVHDFGAQKCEGDWEIGNFKTIDQRFIGMAFGIKKKVRGVRVKQRRPNLWVIDDLETPDTIGNPKRMRKQADQVERDILPTMTGPIRRLLYANNKFARVMTQTILQERHPEWSVNQIKAYDKVTYKPAWNYYTAEYYRQQEKDMGIVAAYAEYLHETKLEGSNFNEDEIQWGKLPPLHEFKMIISHWDIAYTDNEKSDYNAVRVWGLHGRNFWLIACYVKQSKMKPAVEWNCDYKKSLPKSANYLAQFESQFWNGEVQRTIDEVEDDNNIDMNLIKVDTPRSNKVQRIIKTLKPLYQNSRIYYNEDLKSNSDTQIGIMQLCAIEEGSTEHDDAPDADHQAIDKLEMYCTPGSSRRKSGDKSFKAGKMKRKYNMP